MRKMKRIITLVLAAALLLGLAACSQTEKVKISTAEDLKGKTIGVQLGTTGDDIATKDVEAKEVERYTRFVDAITALKQKKIDCIIMDRDTADAYLKNNTDLMQLDVGFEPEQYAIAVKKGDQELLDVVNKVIAQMKSDGSLAGSFEAHEGEAGPAPDLNKGGSAGVLIVGTESGFPPYEYPSGDTIAGVDMDIMSSIAKELSMELEIEDMPFESLIAALTSGKIKAIAAGMTINEERLVNVDFSDPYVDASQVVVIRKTSSK